MATGKRYAHWELDHPATRTIDNIRPIRERIRTPVEALLDSLQPAHD
jgi:arsenate reductase